jgi:competence protein ComFA
LKAQEKFLGFFSFFRLHIGVGSEESYVCPRCGNKDPRYIGMKQGRPYCRKCISFIGAEAASLPSLPKAAPLCLHYSLSEEQKRISDHLIANFEQGDDTLVYAVCGSPQTI